MSERKKTNLSILELAVVPEGQTASDAFAHALDLARHAEGWGYKRVWLAEHHNMVSVASSATAVLIGYIAAGTSSIRVGSGGIMLPNHAPLVVAEQFGTLASLYPGRIDLGLGRAPGTDQLTAMALRRERQGLERDFLQLIQELTTYLSAENNTGRVRAIPGEGLDIPLWILGSSTESAYLAAYLGLPYAFASHFAPAYLHEALRIYRENFRPSGHLKKPYVMACVNVVAADTDREAQRLATSFYQFFLGIVRNVRKPLPPPVDSMEGIWTAQEEAAAAQMLQCSFVGSVSTVADELHQFLGRTGADEIIVAAHIYEHRSRLRSYELLKTVFNSDLLNL